ncbi:MAG: YlbF family regulator [Clostridia bacterium]|nr:YlbF family regulator [Clostridia bacterium]
MHEVFERASALGEAIQQSEEYRAMREAEGAVMADERAAQVMSDFIGHRSVVEEILASDPPDHALLAEHSEAMEALQDALGEMELVQEMTRAREAFTDMMRQVNQVLRFMVTGEVGDDDEDEQEGCGGNCGGCGGGCGHQHLQ